MTRDGSCEVTGTGGCGVTGAGVCGVTGAGGGGCGMIEGITSWALADVSPLSLKLSRRVRSTAAMKFEEGEITPCPWNMSAS